MTSAEFAWRIRRHAIEMTCKSNSSHIASVLSIADIVAVLYNEVMKTFPDCPNNDERDRLILSKGHAGVAVYTALAEKGYFPLNDLKTYCSNGSLLSGHISHIVPGVEFSTGSLGHGIAVAAGMAMAAKVDGKKHHVYVIIGDGECNEGSVWETALIANQFRLSNLTVIIDHNKFQSLTLCEDTLELLDLSQKWESFGWSVININGHDYNEIKTALLYRDMEKPVCIVAHTVKGKGISFMENNILWHYRPPQGDDYFNAIEELEAMKP
ncbi:MAG: transketolase [Oscillospiraceae bacterium]|jgi:transketolase|nr:transketolase [Oscillospiraceae bacterium]